MNPTVGQQSKLDEMYEWTDTIKPFYILSGSAGTGKTFITKKFLDMVDDNVLLTATTHKAVGVLADASGVECKTIHAALGLKPQYRQGKSFLKQDRARMRGNLRGIRIVVVDEASMISHELLNFIKDDAARNNRKYLFIGDHCQIPPINEMHSPIFDLTESEPLTEIIRQGEGSPIITLATQIREVIEGATGVKLQMNAKSAIGNIVTMDSEQFLGAVYDNGFMDDDNDDRVLAWRNVTIKKYNAMICDSYDITDDFVVGLHVVFNEAFIQQEEIVANNGQEGNVTSVEERTNSVGLPYYRIGISGMNPTFNVIPNAYHDQYENYFQSLKAIAITNSSKWLDYYRAMEEYADIRPRFACSVHKAQGSTFRDVYIDLLDIQKCRDDITRYRLIYTAITRATRNVYIRVK